MNSRENFMKTAAILFLSGLLAVSGFILLKGWCEGYFESVQTLRIYISSFSIWGPIILTLIQMMQVILPVLPGFMGCIAGGFWVNYIGISLGSIAAFWLAKQFGVPLVSKMISLEKYEGYMERVNQSRSYTVFLFLSILLPLAPDDFLCYFSGLIDMPWKKFTAIIILGKPWCILAYCILFLFFI